MSDRSKPQGGVWPCVNGNYVHTEGPCQHDVPDARRHGLVACATTGCAHHRDQKWLGGQR